MEIEDILEDLAFNEGRFPRKALREAIAKREEITPFLLNVLKIAREEFEKTVEMCDDDYLGHIYAMFLLAQFREPRAYPLIVDLFSIPGDDIFEVADDIITENLGRILASVCGGDTGLIEQLVKNKEANEYVRGAALDSFLTLVAEGDKSREEAMAYYSSFLTGRLERWPSHLLTNVVGCCSDLYPEEVIEDIKRAFNKGLIDESFIDMNWIENQMALGKEQVLEIMAADPHNRYVRNVIKEMEWWSWFHEREEVIIPEKEKVGRNQPCPCGSGKKYKKCCGAAKENEQEPGFLKHTQKVGQIPGGPALYQVDRDIPLVENGYRIVGPAQAMMDYAKPLVDIMGKDSKKGFETALAMAQVCWSIAVIKSADEEKEIRERLLKKNIIGPEIEALIDIMIERHHIMFPFLHQDAGFYIRERIIDAPEEFTLFDESVIVFAPETIPADMEEEKLIKELQKVDSYVESGEEWTKCEKKFHSFQKRIVRRYGEWCEKKGLDAEVADNFCTAVERYLDFVYQFGNGTLFTIDKKAIHEFVTLFWIRKTYAEPYELSVMPKALELFYIYLKEKGFIDIIDKFVIAINNAKPEFLANLEAYFTPVE